jgi:hypothetical protein
MQTPILCERCKEPVDAFARAGGDCVVVDRAPHGLGSFALFGRLLILIVKDAEPAVVGETVHESKVGGLSRFRAHDDSCTKLPKPKRAPSQERTKKTPIRERRSQ